jgi:beta-lactamase class A
MRFRRPIFIVLPLAMLVTVVCAGCGSVVVQRVSAAAHPQKTWKKTGSSAAQQRLAAAVASLIKADDGHVAVAVADLTTGTEAADDGTQQFDTASIVKVDILAGLLYQLQQAGQTLTAQDQNLATTMIENSDNDSASDLYDTVGGSADLDEDNQVFGLTGTTVGTGGYWGLTSTTADDQLRLLRQVMTGSSVLTVASRDYIQNLMSQVESDQGWGIPAAADSGTQVLVKNGWLPNPTLWVINSIGEIERGQHHLLIAVLSDGNPTEAAGIATVEAIAQKAADAMVAAGT